MHGQGGIAIAVAQRVGGIEHAFEQRTGNGVVHVPVVDRGVCLRTARGFILWPTGSIDRLYRRDFLLGGKPGAATRGDQHPAILDPSGERLGERLSKRIIPPVRQQDVSVAGQVRVGEVFRVDHHHRHMHVMIEQMPELSRIAAIDALASDEQHVRALDIG